MSINEVRYLPGAAAPAPSMKSILKEFGPVGPCIPKTRPPGAVVWAAAG